jgi:S-adenosylmethionine decarboxylase
MNTLLSKIDGLSSSETPISSGTHMICELQNIQNIELLNSLSGIRAVVDGICETYAFSVLGKLEHQFSPQGCSLVYLLSESHISVHTFPEKNYIAMDIYTCREYPNNDVYHEIHRYLEGVFSANGVAPIIIDRGSSAIQTANSICCDSDEDALSFDSKPSPDNPRTPTLLRISGVLTMSEMFS